MLKSSRAALAVPLGVVLIVVMLVVPLPTSILDILITINITFAMVVLAVAMRVKDALEFSAFPSVLLIATLFRLALNVSATRQVLLKAYAGTVIESFGHFVVGGSVVVGLVVFLILFIIQFVVITNGAGRVAEVGARFTLDAMPGKQMSIDADLNAGHINEVEARRRRENIAKEADFYGSMDGASKFVKGDAVAAIVITMVNLLGGFIVGVVQKHMPISQAISSYSLLSVGDGLVSQIPALLLSVSTGIVVTRTSNQSDFGADLLGQLARQGKAMQLAGGVVLGLALLPGLPKIPFILVGGAIFILGRRADATEARKADEALLLEAKDVLPAPVDADSTGSLNVEALELELSLDLLDIVDVSVGGDLLERIKGLRRKLAGELGITLPPVRTRDNLSLGAGEYAIKVFEVEVARGIAPPNRVLAMGDSIASLPGEDTLEPVFKIPAKWIPLSSRAQAVVLGATVVDRVSVIVTHLSEVVRIHASELVNRQQVKEMLDNLKTTAPVVVDEMAQAGVNIGDLQRVVKDLLAESISVRNFGAIVEAVVDKSRVTKDTDALFEAARASLGPSISIPYVSGGVVAVVSLDPPLEERLSESARNFEGRNSLAVMPDEAIALKQQIEEMRERGAGQGFEPIVVCNVRLRAALRRFLQSISCEIPVLTPGEIPSNARIMRLGVVRVVNTAAV